MNGATLTAFKQPAVLGAFIAVDDVERPEAHVMQKVPNDSRAIAGFSRLQAAPFPKVAMIAAIVFIMAPSAAVLDADQIQTFRSGTLVSSCNQVSGVSLNQR